jgi:sugar phosphate isomerase/epimerase
MVSSYSIGNDFVLSDKSESEKQVEYVLKGIDTACSIGTNTVRIFSGDVKEGMSFDTSREWILDGMKRVSEYAEKKGITLAVENHGLLAGKSSQIKFLTGEVKRESLKATTDTGNFLLVNENPLDAVKRLRDVIGFVHFKDFKEVSKDEPYYKSIDGRTFKGVVLGTGDVPLKQIVDYLYETNYDGYLSIEYEGHEDPVQGTIASIEFVRTIIR